MSNFNTKRLAGLSIIAGALFLILVLWRLPQWTIPPEVVDPGERAELLNDSRENILKVIQTLGGLGFFLTAYLAWQNFRIAEDKNVTDRFCKAVEMISEDKMATRLGGIYSLQRIAKDSKEDHQVVMNLLAAFVRYSSQERISNKTSYISIFIENKPRKEVSNQTLRPDIQSALTVIRNRTSKNDKDSLDLSNACLEGAYLSGISLVGANLTSANLRGADLRGANLNYADLRDADLRSAKLDYASLENTKSNENTKI